MSLQGLKESIEEVTEKHVSTILSKAKDESTEILEKAKNRAEAVKREQVEAKKGALESKERSELAIEELKWRKKILNSKVEILDQVFQEAENKLSKVMMTPEYKQFLIQAAIEAILQLPGSEAVVRVNIKDKDMIKRHINDIAKEVKKVKGFMVKVELSKDPVNTIGGVLCHTKDLRKYYNNTIEARILQSRTRLEGKLNNILFRGD